MRAALGRRVRSLGRRPGRVAVASALVLLPVTFAAPAHAATVASLGGAAAAPTLGGWNVSADGNVIDILVDNSTGLAGIHPVTEADFPEAESDFSTGQVGSGLASVFWPGNAVGDFGSLSGELGVPSQMQPLLAKISDPVRASVQYPAGPTSSSYPAGAPNGLFDMHSTAGPNGVSSTADITGSGTKGVLSFSAAKGTSSSVADSTARASATSDVTHVSILGGLIDIGAIKSTATAKSDGKTASGSATTHVVGVTVLGQPASIGSDGLVLPDFAKSLNPVVGPVVQGLISQVVSALGIEITEFPSVEHQDTRDVGYTATTGGLSIKLSFPASAASLLEKLGSMIAPLFPPQAAIVPTLPGLLQGMTVTVTVGRATASATGSPPFSDTFNPSGVPSADSGPSVPSVSSAGAGAGSSGTAVAAATGGTAPATPAPSAPTAAPSLASPSTGSATASATGGRSTGGSALPAAMISLSSPLTAGVVVLGVLAAVAVGYGLWRVARLLMASEAGPVCPLGQDNP